MDLSLHGKVVGISGGASGIGAACALGYLQEGCRVAVCGRDPVKLEAFRRTCAEAGFEDILCRKADVACPEAMDAFLNETVSCFGGLDIWYNNAGIGVHKPLMEVTLDEWDVLMRVNLRGVFTTSQQVARIMIRQGGGVIVNAASFAVRMPVVGNGPYAVSKWGVEALTRVLAAELAPHNIRVFSYTPGMIETDLTQGRINLHREAMTRPVAMGRLGTPADLVPILLMLTSDKASYFTGCTVEISGGKFCVQNPEAAWH